MITRWALLWLVDKTEVPVRKQNSAERLAGPG